MRNDEARRPFPWPYTGSWQDGGGREGVWHGFRKLNLQDTLWVVREQDEILEGFDLVDT